MNVNTINSILYSQNSSKKNGEITFKSLTSAELERLSALQKKSVQLWKNYTKHTEAERLQLESIDRDIQKLEFKSKSFFGKVGILIDKWIDAVNDLPPYTG